MVDHTPKLSSGYEWKRAKRQRYESQGNKDFTYQLALLDFFMLAHSFEIGDSRIPLAITG